MTARSLHVIQTKALPRGTDDFEAKRAKLLEAFEKKIPEEYFLPKDLFIDPPLDVSKIPATCGILTEQEIDITENHDAVALAGAIAKRKYTAVDVVKAFSKRAILAHQLTCCLTQWFMEEAVKRATFLDDYLNLTGKTVGPLHGVPMSIKDHIPVAGTFSSQGCYSTVVFDEEDCQMTQILRDQGAVFYCKTNQPQSLMHLESDSHWGRALNPFNIHLSAGGSTGGEAALIAMKGSVLGVGSDIGGSIRGPSAFCGIYGFKSTSYMLPMRGFLPAPFSGELNVLCSTGPMCRTMRDMDLFMTSILRARPYLDDPRLVPIPWKGLKTPLSTRRLKIGIIDNDGFIEPQPPVKRAISWARSKLSDPKYASLVEVKSYMPYKAPEAWSMAKNVYWMDGAKGVKEAIVASGEPLYPLSQWIWKDSEPLGMRTVEDVNVARRERDEFRCRFAEDWNKQDIDVALGPAFVGPACAHDTAFYWTYTSLYNFVDYPGVVFPTPIATGTKLSREESYDPDYSPLSEACSHVKRLWEDGNEGSGFQGSPVALQLVARKYHDNELFGALSVLREILGLP